MGTKEEQKLIDKLVDQIIKHCPENVGFNCHSILSKIEGLEKSNITTDKVRLRLIDLGYATKHGNLPVLLTTLGREVKSFGGHIKYQKHQREKAKKIAAKEKLEIEVLRTTIAQNRYLYRTRNYTYIASGIAIIISVFALWADCSGR